MQVTSIALEYPQWVLSLWPAKNISDIQVLLKLLFCNPTHKTKTGPANKWVTTISKPAGAKPIRNQEQQSDHIAPKP